MFTPAAQNVHIKLLTKKIIIINGVNNNILGINLNGGRVLPPIL